MRYTIVHVHVKPLRNAAEFLSKGMPLFLANEARANLVLGIAGTLRDEPRAYDSFRLWLVERESNVVAAALRTPPYNLVVTGDPDAAEALADALVADEADLPGVTGNLPEVDHFVLRWQERTGNRAHARVRQRVYALETLRLPAAVPGAPREATADDRELLVDWIQEFAAEALHELSPAGDAARTVDARLAGGRGGFMLWESGEPVSLAGWGGPTPNGIRIGPVYTPPEHRRHGYGSAVTAAASLRNLEAGRRFCFLYTDLANPTSNKIYAHLGYEPVCDSIEYGFVRA